MPSLILSRQRQRALPMLVVLAMHGILLIAWLGAKRPKLQHGAEPTLFAMLIPAAKPQPAPAPATFTPPARSTPAEAPTATAPEMPEPAVVPDVQEVTAESPKVSDTDMLARARRDVGAIDRALRGKTPPVPIERPDSRWSRFERKLESAYIDLSYTSVMDRYVSADGVVVTRLTQGSRVRCFMSGTVNGTNGVLSDSSRPRPVNCPPANAGWSRL